MADTEKRMLILHFGSGVVQRLKFFSRSSREDLLTGIREVLGVATDTPLRFRDEDGDILLVTAGDWRRWARATGAKISDDGLAIKAGDASWAVYTPTLPTSGKHYMVIDFPEDRLCCIAAGVIPSTVASVPVGQHNISNAAPPCQHMIALKGIGAGPSEATNDRAGSAKPLQAGVFLDADARMLVFVDHNDPLNAARAIRLDNIPTPAVFVIQAPKHPLNFAILPAAQLPAGGVFTGDSARFDKVAWKREQEAGVREAHRRFAEEQEARQRALEGQRRVAAQQQEEELQGVMAAAAAAAARTAAAAAAGAAAAEAAAAARAARERERLARQVREEELQIKLEEEEEDEEEEELELDRLFGRQRAPEEGGDSNGAPPPKRARR
ncbi:hypothetical protein HYH03_005811 [Edaphochlamys debaryana]|uniref:Uncharacterized protein n=1 Tax=Edaphochlamys debaryana TaxID=47281 RepID=A0A836C221_9CHLO|nr:hypothetical protein HYH03_005811 [Edaphochlamys debaryana]|eukprot:KAG2496213.1 hypothetical protein HYH03_005811 [Edaphochlamys debaryana]